MGNGFFSRIWGVAILIAGFAVCCLLALVLAAERAVYDFDPEWSPAGQAVVFVCFAPSPELDLSQLIERRRYYGDMPYRDIYSELCTITPDGRQRRRLTDNKVKDAAPAWSPDGRRIAFVSDREGGRFLHLMNADGTEQRRISQTNGAENPAWSFDGQRIAFSGGKIQILDLASGAERVLNDTRADYATWSPRGDALAFIEGRRLGQTCQTHIVRAETGGEMVPPFASACYRPAWNPQGTDLAFVGAELQPERGRLLFVYDLQAQRIVPLTGDYQYVGDSLVWSPSGDRVYYVAGVEIFGARTDGSGSIQVTHGASVLHHSEMRNLTVSPDGKAMVFVRGEGEAKADIAAVWRVNSDGSNLVRLSP